MAGITDGTRSRKREMICLHVIDRTIAESKKKHEEKQLKAQQLRDKLREEKSLKLQKLLERVSERASEQRRVDRKCPAETTQGQPDSH